MKRHFSLSKFFTLKFLWSHAFIIIYIGLLFSVFFGGTLDHFFVADDFSWIRWAKDSNMSTLLFNFIDAQGFFFRPIDKIIIYAEYNLFGLNPYPYYVLNLLFNFFVSISAYFLFYLIFKNKALAFLGTVLFSFLPSHTQNLFWIATISTTLSTLFIILGLILYFLARTRRSFTLNVLAMLSFFLSVFSYENAVIFIFLMMLTDLILLGKKSYKKKASIYFSYVSGVCIILLYLTLRYFANAAGFSGDYDYNMFKVLPNSVGNFIGYLLMLFSGEHLLHIYSSTRENLKQYWIVLSIAGAFIAAFAGGFMIEHKEKIHVSDDIKLFSFGLLFSIISLLPYLPLGNITLRYMYLGSFGFIIMIVVVVRRLVSFYSNTIKVGLYGIICIIFLSLSYIYMANAAREWSFASRVTLQSFSYFNSIDTEKNMNTYIYNVPIKSGEAYIFPVGIVDMIYLSNKNITPFLTSDLESSISLSNKDKKEGIDSVILTYDKDFKLKVIYEK